MGILPPPPTWHPDFERIMNRRSVWMRVQLAILVGGVILLAAALLLIAYTV